MQVADTAPKPWAAWGSFNEQHFKERSRDVTFAVQAVTCYLSAAKQARPDRARRVRRPPALPVEHGGGGGSEGRCSPKPSLFSPPRLPAAALHRVCASERILGLGVSAQLLARALWLIGLDEVGTNLGNTLDNHDDVPIWHWITFIPQLLASLGRPEARFAQSILLLLVKNYPQSMYCPLRTALFDIRERIQARQPAPAVRVSVRAQWLHRSVPR